MHEYSLLEILAVGFALALVFGCLAHRVGLSPIVGYLLAGFLVGPQSPGFVADLGLAQQLSEAGVILLMFGVGLHFDLKDLMAVKGVSLPGALIQSAVATVCGALAAGLLGFALSSGLMLGLGLAVASTVVLLRVLTDNGALDTPQGHVAVGWLVVEDLFTVLILVLLPSLAVVLSGTESLDLRTFAKAVGGAVLRLGLLWALVLVAGGRVVPWLLTQVVRTRSRELFTLAVLVAAFATAVGAAVFFQASMALGAFLGGMVIGKTKVSHQAGADLLPLRDAFAVLFFLSVGMLFKPAFILEQPLLIVLCLLIVLVIKPLVALLVVTLLGYSVHTGLTVATALAQVGEFSFILAQQAQALGLVSDMVYNVLVVCALVSITLNPGYFRAIPGIEGALRRRPGLWKMLNARTEAREKRDSRRKLVAPAAAANEPQGRTAVVVGYGPTGKSVAKALAEQHITPVIIDLNVDTVNELNAKERRAVFGDATKREVLLAAGIEQAGYLVLTLPMLDYTVAAATMAKSLNPELRILVRARFVNDSPILQTVGVDGIALEEEEVARALTALLLDDMERCADGRCAAGRPSDLDGAG
jgi:CPA2 family monovalent cation:H+ antiporter-2